MTLFPLLNDSVYTSDDRGLVDVSNFIKAVLDENRRSTSQRAFLRFVATLTKNGFDLIAFSDNRDVTMAMRYKIIGVVVLDCLLDVTDEISYDKRTNIVENIRRLFETEKASVESLALLLRTAAQVIGHFARIASTTEIEYLQNLYLTFILQKLIVNLKADSHRYGGALILQQLAINLPQLVYAKRKLILPTLWDLVSDKHAMVRGAAASTLEAVLQLISQREDIGEYIKSALKFIQTGFTSNLPEKILGSLIILNIIASGNVVSGEYFKNTVSCFHLFAAADLQSMVKVSTLFNDVIIKAFQRKDAREQEVRLKVIEIIPKLAATFTPFFLQPNTLTGDQTLLTYAIKHMLNAAKSPIDRDASFLALGSLV